MQNRKMVLMYDGTDYSGWQFQPNQRTVQAEVERALSVFAHEPVKVIGASRTDAGVHANHYVCSFQTAFDAPDRSFCYGLNGILPRDIRVKSVEIVPESFHARYDAKSKTYIYYVDNSPFGNVFFRRYAWRFPYPLDFARMLKAKDAFIGRHDFKAFQTSGSDTRNTVREIYDFSIDHVQDSIYRFSVTGNGFLYNMVRIMVGTLVSIGNGKIEPDDLPAIIAAGRREKSGITAPPQGLILQHISYDFGAGTQPPEEKGGAGV